MSVMVKRMVGLGVVATVLAFPAGAVESGEPRADHCRSKVAGWVKSATEMACSPSRHPEKTQGANQAARGRDALLHYRGGESRPRMVRAANEIQAFVPQA